MCLLVISKCQDHGGTTNLKECIWKFDALQAVSVHEFVITLFKLCHIVLFLQIVVYCRCVVREPAVLLPYLFSGWQDY